MLLAEASTSRMTIGYTRSAFPEEEHLHPQPTATATPIVTPRNSDCHGNCDANRNSDGNSDCHSNCDANRNSDGDSDCHGNCDANRNSDGDSDCYGNCFRLPDAYAQTDAHCETPCDAEAAPDSAAAPGRRRKLKQIVISDLRLVSWNHGLQ